MAQSYIDENVRRGIRQLRVLEDRILSGSLDPRQMRGRLQDLIEGNFSYDRVPWWYLPPEVQSTLVRNLLDKLGYDGWDWDVPPVPEFKQTTETEVLMLCVYLPDDKLVRGFRRTIGEIGRLLCSPSPQIRLGSVEIREREDMRHRVYRPGVRWVGIDLEANVGRSVRDLVYMDGATNLADVEVMMAAWLFNDWLALWDGVNGSRRESVPRPMLGNLKYDFFDDDYGVPVFDIEERHDKEDQLGLHTWVDHVSSPKVCVPTVREL